MSHIVLILSHYKIFFCNKLIYGVLCLKYSYFVGDSAANEMSERNLPLARAHSERK